MKSDRPRNFPSKRPIPEGKEAGTINWGYYGVPDQVPTAGVSEAGDLKAGSPAPAATGDVRKLRVVAGAWLLEELKKKVMARNTVLGNIHRDCASIDAPTFLRMYQTDVDMFLWVITCCGLVEIDEQAKRYAACPDDMRDTFLRVLGRR